ncbi:retention in endoplasmic reticulum protein 1 [Conglomerata obtusa]
MKLQNLTQIYLDRITPYKRERWIVFFILFVAFFMRILIIQRFFLICYCLSIYLLHTLIEFLTPKEENIPDPFENFDDDVYIPQSIDDEFRPFIRRLPEFNFWLLSFKLVGFSFLATFFDFFDIPVFVPILVFYFILIVCITAKNLYKHMKKYQYNPFYTAKDSFKERN